MQTIEGNVYDYPKYYDLLFGSDWKAEFDFLRACFRRHASRPIRRLFEPACGTGRLLIKLAQAGFDVSGNDLNPKAVAYCNARLGRNGFRPSVEVSDMADFRLGRKVDAAFNTINSFRHLQTEREAEAHLACVARALAKGGLYVLGLHLTPLDDPNCDEESWSAQRGNLSILSRMWTKKLDRRRRREEIGFTFDITTPKRQFRLVDQFTFRTYSARQFHRLLDGATDFQRIETYDFDYDLEKPVRVDRYTEDVLYVLRKK